MKRGSKPAVTKNKGESGQTLVEFALVVPLLLLLVFGTIEFGRIYHAQLVVASAAREGARKAAVTGVEDDIKTAIQNAAATLNITKVTWRDSIINDPAEHPSSGDTLFYCVCYPQADGSRPTDGSYRKLGSPVEVYVRGRADLMVPIISNLIGTPKPLPAKAVMMVEH